MKIWKRWTSSKSDDKPGACDDWQKSSALGCFEANALLPLCDEATDEDREKGFCWFIMWKIPSQPAANVFILSGEDGRILEQTVSRFEK